MNLTTRTTTPLVALFWLFLLVGSAASAWLATPALPKIAGSRNHCRAAFAPGVVPLRSRHHHQFAVLSQQQQLNFLHRLSAGGPAVLEPPTKEETTKEIVDEKANDEKKESAAADHKRGGWAVRLFNDPFNKREFVSMVLCQICGLSDGQAYQVMMQAHKNGVSVVGRYDLERAELYKTALVENGLVSDMIPVDDD